MTQCFKAAIDSIEPFFQMVNDDSEEDSSDHYHVIIFDYDLLVEQEKIVPLYIQITEENLDIINLFIKDKKIIEDFREFLEFWKQHPDQQI